MVMQAFDPNDEPDDPDDDDPNATRFDLPASFDRPAPPDPLTEVVVDERAVVGGLPIGALAAIVLVVGALVAILFLG
jgi:hypothetical protein